MTDTDAPTRPETDIRAEIPERFRWNLADIYPDWAAWEAACKELEALIEAYAACQGSLKQGAAALLKVLQLGDELGQLSYKVYFYPSLHHDEDQRDNSVDARRQQAQILFARSSEASAWFDPELLAIPLEQVRSWLDEDEALARLPLRARGALPPAGARARRGGRAAALAGRALQRLAGARSTRR